MSKKSGSGDISATIDESNAMRKKLGIKPLDVSADNKNKVGTSANPKTAPHLETGDGKPAEADVKKRIAASRNKREHEEMTAGQGLGDILASEGSASDWIARTRGADGAMKKPKTAQEKKGKETKGKEAQVGAGTKVRHDADQLVEGENILTLADRNILDEDGNIDDRDDELANPRMLDEERAKHNDAIRNQKEYDRDLDGQNILSKYDELKTGPKGFVLGGQVMGVIEETDPEKRLAILTHLSEKSSLDSGVKLQSDYYTSKEMEEMSKFRSKPKKKAKKRQRTADDKKDKDNNLPVAPAGSAVAPPGRVQDAGSDEEDPELYEQLSKQRRLVRRSDAGAVRKGEAALAAVADKIQVVEKEAEEKDEQTKKDEEDAGFEKDKVSMTATTEFCNIVQTPLEKVDTMKHESFRGSTLYKAQAAQRKGVKAGSAGYKKGEHVADEVLIPEETIVSSETQLKEHSLDLSCASGLAYLRARSQMGNDQETHKNKKSDNRPLEMSTVDGDIKLEYRDDYGRVQTPKEAFRAISWKFHGKVPGRKNMERRLLRLENEMKLKSMNPFEQLPTLRALKHVQVADAKPYMVLSGANEK